MTHSPGSACDHATMPSARTEPCDRFFRSYNESLELIAFLGSLSDKADDTVRAAASALVEIAAASDEETARRAKEGAGAVKRFRGFTRLLLEILLCRTVDNFLAYVSEGLGQAYRQRPDMLRTDEKVSYKELLGLSSRDELVEYLAEKKVHRLSYGSLEDLATTLEQQHGLVLFPSRDALKRASVLNASRNLLVHNRGLVNRVYLAAAPESTQATGSLLALPTDFVFDGTDFLAASVCHIDRQFIEKFSVPALPH